MKKQINPNTKAHLIRERVLRASFAGRMRDSVRAGAAKHNQTQRGNQAKSCCDKNCCEQSTAHGRSRTGKLPLPSFADGQEAARPAKDLQATRRSFAMTSAVLRPCLASRRFRCKLAVPPARVRSEFRQGRKVCRRSFTMNTRQCGRCRQPFRDVYRLSPPSLRSR